MKQEEDLKKAIPVDDEELAKVNGGTGPTLTLTMEPTERCPYCDELLPAEQLEEHMKQCPNRPKTRFI